MVLREYMAVRKTEPKISIFDFVRYRNPYIIAHHNPKQNDFDQHVWNLNGVFLCKGCVLVLAGCLIGFSVLLLLRLCVNVSIVS